jgi:N-acetyl-anhydromuramyl-L-alanine amidase AmpD
MVPLELTAWTPGNDVVAERSINVEMSGFQSKGYTDAQYKSMAAFFRWCVAQGCPIPATYVGKSGTAGIIGHQDVLNPNWPDAVNQFGGCKRHTDPGPLFQWPRFVALCASGGMAPEYSPIAQYVAEHGGTAVFGKVLGGVYGTNGSIEQNYEYAHLYVDKATGKVIAEMKDRVNPKGFSIGPGVYSVLQAEGMKLLPMSNITAPTLGKHRAD